MPKFVVRHSVEHDHKRYVEGETITLDDEVAAPLLQVGAIAKPVKDKPASEPDAPAGEAG